ncbi:MAG: hypothetical protein GC168_15760 [Candidatus Hydrogenedens sp.]|nr:hypothetical protein [Candidatus Hydrogenedens sp.]
MRLKIQAPWVALVALGCLNAFAQGNAPECDSAHIGIPGVSLELVADIHPTGDSYPEGFSKTGTTIYFGATEPEHGRELWMTDGTTTQLKKDIYPGATGSGIRGFTYAGTKPCFVADDDSAGLEFWKWGNVPFSLNNPQAIFLKDLGSGFLWHAPLRGSDKNAFIVAEPAAWPSPGTLLYRSDGTEEGTFSLGGISGLPHGGGSATVRSFGLNDLVLKYTYL